MSLLDGVALVLALSGCMYLVVALVKPEWFE